MSIFNKFPVTESTNQEIEHMVFVDVLDIGEIERNADSVKSIEQWEIRSIDKDRVNATVRVRSTDGVYEMAVKRYGSKVKGATETEEKISKEMFKAFRSIAPVGTIKKRYYFKQAGLVFEIDVFEGSGKTKSNWVKVDVEVDEYKEIHFKPEHFPFKVAQIIYGDKLTDDIIRKIYANEWTTRNINSINTLEVGEGVKDEISNQL